MDAPPEREDCRPFVHVAALLADAGVHAPRVLAQDLARGFLLLTDLGTTTYLAALDASNADRAVRRRDRCAGRWQLASPTRRAAALRRRAAAPRAHALPRLVRRPPPRRRAVDAERADLARVFDTLIADHLAQPRVFVHRDYMPRNLMVSEPNPGVLDFQDAVDGPITYDIAVALQGRVRQLGRGARASTARSATGRRRGARACPSTPTSPRSTATVEWMGLQRHLKVARHLRAHQTTATASRATSRTRRASSRYVRPVAQRYARARAARAAPRPARGTRAAVRLHVLMPASRHRDDPRRGPRRAHAPAVGRDAEAAACGRRHPAHRAPDPRGSPPPASPTS